MHTNWCILIKIRVINFWILINVSCVTMAKPYMFCLGLSHLWCSVINIIIIRKVTCRKIDIPHWNPKILIQCTLLYLWPIVSSCILSRLHSFLHLEQIYSVNKNNWNDFLRLFWDRSRVFLVCQLIFWWIFVNHSTADCFFLNCFFKRLFFW